MITNSHHFITTIIITTDLHDNVRGYTLKGREFKVEHKQPQKLEALTLDGHKVVDEYWVVSLKEYLKVVPEAANDRFEDDKVLIPTFVCVPSIKPCYL